MMMNSKTGRAVWRGLALAGIVAGAMSAGSLSAFAGSCPADKVVPPGQGQKPGAAMPKDVTDTVIGSIDLSKEPAAINDRTFRLRKLVIQAGGVVPWHSHGDRPAIIYVVDGEITEYASTCAVPIIHKAGDVAVETHDTSHWWKNTGKKPVVLLSSDLLHDPMDTNMM